MIAPEYWEVEALANKGSKLGLQADISRIGDLTYLL
jgi:hypothetical protein